MIIDDLVYFFEIRVETKLHSGKLVIDAQISWVYTADLQAASNFYRQLPGLELVHDQGRARVFATAANAYPGVCEAFDGRVVDDVDAWYRRMVERRLEVDPPERADAFGIYAFRLHGPDGYVIEFQQFDR